MTIQNIAKKLKKTRSSLRSIFIKGLRHPLITYIITLPVFGIDNPIKELPLLWHHPNGQINHCGKSALNFLEDDLNHGIVDQETPGKKISIKESLLEKDAHITTKILDRIKSVTTGQSKPSILGSKKARLTTQDIKPKDVLTYVFATDPQCHLLNHLGIPNPQYQRLKNILSEYMELEEEFRKLDFNDLPLQLDDQHRFIKTLKKVLWYYGEMDSDPTHPKDFDPSTVQAIKSLQRYLGLSPDGIVGQGTYDKILSSLNHRIAQIIVNMERWRWYPLSMGDKYALVNIPSYELYTFEDGRITNTIKAIVGMESRPTPLLISTMSKVILNPAWTLPPIIVQDKVQQTGGSLSALRSMNYQITDLDGRYIDNPDFYDVRQIRITVPPGPYNGLGGYMFYVKNDMAIYPHGTNQPDKFKYMKRTFSSGCIRLEKPEKIAMWSLQNNSKQKWSLDDLKRRVSENKTVTIDFNQDINFYVAYATVFIDDNGGSTFYEDPYGIDTTMIKALGIKDRISKRNRHKNGGSDGT